ncbi:MAG: OmpA family protein [Flavobacteriales bacterium]|nr:OmpA family protein [Flavobacteriales bacterium]
MERPAFSLLTMLSLLQLHAMPDQLAVHFRSASCELSAADRQAIHALCDRPDAQEIQLIALRGHTDPTGSAAFNEKLSRSRAERVRAELSSTCLHDVPITISWAGASEPKDRLARSDAADRRVDITIHFKPAETTDMLPRVDVIRPLMPPAAAPRQHFIVDASQPVEFVADDGVRVRIPARSIVDASGTTVEGPVDLTYRSFTDPWAMIASGIPMHVGHGSDAGHMESIGMFEVIASRRGERLHLREGEAISLTPPIPPERTSAYKDWMLDETTGEWSDRTRGTNGPEQGRTTGTASAACLQYAQEMRKLPSVPDSTHFMGRLASPEYCGTVPCSPADRPFARVGSRVVSPYSDRDIAMIQVVVDRGAYRWQPVTGFRIEMKNARTHSEWLAFPRNRTWAYTGPMHTRSFHRRIARRHFYQDVLLEVDDDGKHGVIRLKDRGTWIDLPIDLGFHCSTEADRYRWNSELSAYAARATAKRTRFDRRLDERSNAVNTATARIKEQAWTEARPLMNDDELALTAQEFHDLATTTAQRELASMLFEDAPTANAIASSFAMQGFGLYNCDRILEREVVEPARIAVLSKDDAPFPWTSAYGVMGRRKAVITYWGNGTGSGDHMKLSRDITDLLFVGLDGSLLMVSNPANVARSNNLVLRGNHIQRTDGADAFPTTVIQ